MNSTIATKPTLGFVGVGWIGKSRLEAVMKSEQAIVAAVSEPNQTLLTALTQQIPTIQTYDSLEAMLESDLTGIVIATPSALHAPQALAALQRGKAVFCQKPLGRHAPETAEVVAAARAQNLLLGVDFSYRHTQAMQQVKQVIDSGELGRIYGVNLTFHNAYGPDKAWYLDLALSGGGCLMDLGIHLVDLLFWLLDQSVVTEVRSHFFRQGRRLHHRKEGVEDYAACQWMLNHTTAVQLSCSWFLPAGQEAVIEVRFYGENGGVAFRNINGSFYDFVAERYHGTATETLATPPDDWSERAAARWAEALAQGQTFNPEAQTYVAVAQVLDQLYQANP